MQFSAGLFSLLFSFFSVSFHINAKESDSTAIILNKMFNSIERIYSLQYNLTNKERINGKMMHGEQRIKYICNPKMYYVKLLKPDYGAELLYIKGKNDNLVLFNPNSFPFIKINLDPTGSLMRKNNHHTIFQIGFDYIKNSIEKVYAVNKNYFSYVGVERFDDKICYRIDLSVTDYKIIEYTMKNGETISDIAETLLISDYKILELNKLNDYKYSKPGTKIKIPSHYGKKIELYIDSNTFLPILQIIYDEKGLFERYEYTKILLNPKFNSKDFILT
jgi:hypothetical protein